jgi:hypothetical protein
MSVMCERKRLRRPCKDSAFLALTLQAWAAQNPKSFINRLSRSAAWPSAAQSVPLIINGTGFAADATVNFDQASLTPRSVTGTQINVAVSAPSLATAGAANVTAVKSEYGAARRHLKRRVFSIVFSLRID